MSKAMVKQHGWLVSALFSLWVMLMAIVLMPFAKIDHADLYSQQKLQQIRQSLIAWSVSAANPGSLPCPEDTALLGTANEGSAKASCSAGINMGFIPWRTLGLGKIRDAHGEPFIYLIATGFTKSPINSASLTSPDALAISLDGNPVVALVASAGYPTRGQQRTKIFTQLKNYFEGLNADADNQFFSPMKCADCNDLILGLTAGQLFSAVNMRVLREVRGDQTQGLIKYWLQYRFFPYADSNRDGYADSSQLMGSPSYQGGDTNLTYFSTWLKKNNWFEQIQYQLSPDKSKVTLSIQQQVLQVAP